MRDRSCITYIDNYNGVIIGLETNSNICVIRENKKIKLSISIVIFCISDYLR